MRLRYKLILLINKRKMLRNYCVTYVPCHPRGVVRAYYNTFELGKLIVFIDETEITLLSIVIHPLFRGKGVGRRLIQRMIHQFEKGPFICIKGKVGHDAVRGFYSKLDFTVDAQGNMYRSLEISNAENDPI